MSTWNAHFVFRNDLPIEVLCLVIETRNMGVIWSAKTGCMTSCFLLDFDLTIFPRMSFLSSFLVLFVFVNGCVLSLKLSFEETNFLQDCIEQNNVEDIVIIIERGLNDWIAATSNIIMIGLTISQLSQWKQILGQKKAKVSIIEYPFR